MTVTALGQLSVGAAVPGVTAAVSAGSSGISTVLPELQSRLAMLLALPPVSPSFTQQITIANDIAAAATASIALGLPLPDIASALAAAIAALQAVVAVLSAKLDVLVGLQAPLIVDGVGVYAFDGTRDQLGPELAGALGPGNPHAQALLFVALDPAAWSALSAVVRVTP